MEPKYPDPKAGRDALRREWFKMLEEGEDPDRFTFWKEQFGTDGGACRMCGDTGWEGDHRCSCDAGEA